MRANKKNCCWCPETHSIGLESDQHFKVEMAPKLESIGPPLLLKVKNQINSLDRGGRRVE